MTGKVALGLLIPFLGTMLGSGCVYFMKRELKRSVQRALTGFAAGVMVAASIWSLITPAMNLSEQQGLGKLAFIPSVIGFLVGIAFLLLLDRITPHLHMNAAQSEGPRSRVQRATMMVLAVTLHNIPEGMTLGIVYAGLIAGLPEVTAGRALALSLGIAIQNFPEGAIISMPLHAEGMRRNKAFGYGTLTGAVEPIGALLTIFFAKLFLPIMPYFLAFAAGAMLYVVVEELIPEMSEGEHSNIGVILFALGFALMMALDVALG